MLWFCLGILIGMLFPWIFIKKRFMNGSFNINETDATKDVYKMIVDDFNKLHRRRYLLLRITRK